jgi:hypothetical protein
LKTWILRNIIRWNITRSSAILLAMHKPHTLVFHRNHSRTSQRKHIKLKIEKQIIRENRRNEQYRDTGNIGHTRQRTKSNKAMKKNKNQPTYTTQHSKLHVTRWAVRTPPKTRVWTQMLVKDKHVLSTTRHPPMNTA